MMEETRKSGDNKNIKSPKDIKKNGIFEITGLQNKHISIESETMLQMIWRQFRLHKLALFSTVILIFMFGISFIIPLFISEDVGIFIDFSAMRQPPSWEHLFGTDDIGRDLFMRSVYGGRISLRIGILSAIISITIGISVGGISGYYPGLPDNILMRFTEALLSIPRLFILIVLARIVGNSIAVVTVVIGGLSWMDISRIVRANVLSIKEQDFVLASISIGTRPQDILRRHILPNTVAPIVVAATLGVGQAIILESYLSFLGLGLQPPTATWGNMLNRAQSFLVDAPWIAFFPGLMILITILCVNFIGDGLRDALDPHSDL